MSILLDGKVAIVTGGSRGIGKGIALSLAEDGADVAVNYNTQEERANEVVKEIMAMGRDSIAIKADVSNGEEVNRMIDTAISKFNKIDILVNNAGTTKAQTILDTTEEDWDMILDLNLKGTFLCSKAVFKIMMKQGYGRIINISSIAAKRGTLYGRVHYSSSKAGQIGFTKTLARTAAPHGVTVNAVAPGHIGTESFHGLVNREKIEQLKKMIPLGYIGECEDVGNAVVFLASDKARYITGATLDVNGGAYMD